MEISLFRDNSWKFQVKSRKKILLKLFFVPADACGLCLWDTRLHFDMHSSISCISVA